MIISTLNKSVVTFSGELSIPRKGRWWIRATVPKDEFTVGVTVSVAFQGQTLTGDVVAVTALPDTDVISIHPARGLTAGLSGKTFWQMPAAEMFRITIRDANCILSRDSILPPGTKKWHRAEGTTAASMLASVDWYVNFKGEVVIGAPWPSSIGASWRTALSEGASTVLLGPDAFIFPSSEISSVFYTELPERTTCTVGGV